LVWLRADGGTDVEVAHAGTAGRRKPSILPRREARREGLRSLVVQRTA
jgi:hypothetical protein